MFIRFIVSLILFACFTSSFAQNANPEIILLPNVNTQYLMETNAEEAVKIQNKAIEMVKSYFNVNASSPYRAIRIMLHYDAAKKVDSMIVYLLSARFKSFELVKLNVNNFFNVTATKAPYQLQESDLMQLPAYAHKRMPICPDNSVQFVIGNNFHYDRSVEKEVQKIYELAKSKGYNPYLMDVNDQDGPQPTIEAYLDWMSCDNVKGFYNESHGWERGILLSDGDLYHSAISQNLIDKLKNKVVLFDSCETFHDPLLSAVIHAEKGNAQQYVAGIISLPFGASERTASCFWDAAFKHEELNRTMLNDCAEKNELEIDGFGIGGNGDNHLSFATEPTQQPPQPNQP